MPTLTLGLDYAGRPVIMLNVGASAAARETLFADQRLPPSLSIRALIDTGASRTVVEERFLRALGLDEVGVISLQSATTGAHPVPARAYVVNVASAEDVTGILAVNLEVVAVEDLSGFGVEAMLGRDVLNSCLLLYDGPGRMIRLTFPPFESP